MTEELASLQTGVDICYETFGDRADPPVLLIMGLGGPMGWWSLDFCEALAARGYFVIRYDNRDTGGSTKFRGRRVRKADVIRAFAGDRRRAVYTLSDLGDDALGLLDHLGIESAHVTGVSMGGMIAQTIAISTPARVRSLTSIMSSTGRRSVGWQDPRLFRALLDSPGKTRESYIERSMRGQKLIGSAEFPTPFEVAYNRAGETYDRGWIASGVLRQMLAILSQPDRTAALRTLEVPTCVVHGLSDRLVHCSGGRATAAAIPHAELVLVPGLGHDLPIQLRSTFVGAIDRTARRYERSASATNSSSAAPR